MAEVIGLRKTGVVFAEPHEPRTNSSTKRTSAVVKAPLSITRLERLPYIDLVGPFVFVDCLNGLDLVVFDPLFGH